MRRPRRRFGSWGGDQWSPCEGSGIRYRLAPGLAYLAAMATTKPKHRSTPTARKTRKKRAIGGAAQPKPERKLFLDQALFGALPDMGQWAFPLLKELRDE